MSTPEGDQPAECEQPVTLWPRLRELWRSTGLIHDSDEQIAEKLRRFPDVPPDRLIRRQDDDPRHSARLRPKNAQAFVRAVLGVDYDAKPPTRLAPYRGTAPRAFVDRLNSLPERELLAFADAWVAYLRFQAKVPPLPPWEAERESQAAPVPPATLAPEAAVAPALPAALAPEAAVAPMRPAANALDATPAPPEPGVPLATGRKLGLTMLGIGALLAAGVASWSYPQSKEPSPRAPVTSLAAPPPTQATVAVAQPLPPVAQAQVARRSVSPSDRPSAPPDDPRAPARISIEGEHNGVRRAVHGGDSLKTGDSLWFQVEVQEPLFVYLVQIGANGSLDLIYPQGRAVQLSPGRRQRVPGLREGSFKLDDRPGTERILLLTTNQALSRGHAELLPLLRALADDGRWPRDWPPPSAAVASREAPHARAAGEASSHAQLQTRGLVFAAASGSMQASDEPVLMTAEFVSLGHLR